MTFDIKLKNNFCSCILCLNISKINELVCFFLKNASFLSICNFSFLKNIFHTYNMHVVNKFSIWISKINILGHFFFTNAMRNFVWDFFCQFLFFIIFFSLKYFFKAVNETCKFFFLLLSCFFLLRYVVPIFSSLILNIF